MISSTHVIPFFLLVENNGHLIYSEENVIKFDQFIYNNMYTLVVAPMVNIPILIAMRMI